MEQSDILIAGGGMVGAASALALADLGLEVTLFEAQEPKLFDSEQPMDLRVSAISQASERLLENLGGWTGVASMRSAPYRTLETWEWQGARICFDAGELGLSHLGHIVENRILQLSLWQAVRRHSRVRLMTGIRPERFWQDDQGAWLEADGRFYRGQLLLGCDGAQSQVRRQAGIGVSGWNYRQHCLAINIRTERPQQDGTWQEFTPTGPRALLPLAGPHASLVWYDAPETIARLKRLPIGELKRAILSAFPDRLGQFEIEQLASFPLTRQHAKAYYQGRVVLLGDAAHTINPLAGQGVNLGFKDVAALAEVVRQGMEQGEPIYSDAVLKRYQRRRHPDNLAMQTAMDAFYLMFSNDHLPLKLARNLGLTLAEHSGPIKRKVMQYAMGL
ncbi:2-octaprenyl-3-methyl-6-methoxy-1,4-benzoquinol hydroxylase [Ferrimonas sediminicola]|uniref:2-octaprenyl-3-methyl-6-methoxy-1,4-benzoquinol hydroxylase n=1 Tax=Ferrimonas sediminicola TaxID=2569538 RepID=A0A4U1BF14_9GAMM|nr:FAD-dependent monooxygenase [Ferrimonas sediminicola]TKB49475.1 2-octaprenyl-3-methyl-6-methoxy-1,4-benzoquinol hydroxylase [Ferrimonas sediminicola]